MKYRRTEPLIFGDVPRGGSRRRSMIVHCPACNTAHEIAWAAPNQRQDQESTKFQCFGCGEKQLETPDIPERVGLRIDLVTGPVQPDEPISFAPESLRLHNFVLQRAEVIVWWAILAACTVSFVYSWSIKEHVVGKQLLWMSRFGIPLSIIAIFQAKSAAAKGDEDETRQMRWMLLMLASWASPAAIEYVYRF